VVRPAAARGSRLRQLAWIAIAVAIGYLAWRGVWRAVGYDQDLNVGYAAGQAWLFGRDPYDADVLRNTLVSGGNGEVAFAESLVWRLNVYFPTTIPLFLAVAFVPWSVATLGLIVVNVAAAIGILWGMLRLLGWRWSETRSLWLTAFFLSLAPVHATITAGQTGLLSMLALVVAFNLERDRRGTGAGLAYGMATALKVQIGLPFVAFAAWRRRWASAGVAVAVIGLLTLVSVGRMELAGVPWAASWLANLGSLSATGGLNDPGIENTQRYALVNLQFALSSALADPFVVQAITLAIVGAAAVALVWFLRGGRPYNEVLALSVVAVLGLMVTYHRYYDAVVLVLPIAWAIGALDSERRRYGIAVLALCATYLVPVQTALIAAENGGWIPASIADSFMWDVVLLPLHAWVLVILAAVLLGAVARQRKDGGPVMNPAAVAAGA
jgi:hypothetical protein